MVTHNVISVDSMAHISAEPEIINTLKKKLTITSTGRNPFTLELFYTDGLYAPDMLGIPRALVLPQTKKINGEWDGLAGKSCIELEPEQVVLENSFLKHLESFPYGGIIKAPTGRGKTVQGIDLAYKLGLKTLVVVPLDALMQQWKDRLTKPSPRTGKYLTSLLPEDVGFVQGPRCEYVGKSFVIAMIHSLAQREYPQEFYEQFGTVIFDEVHTTSTATFAKVVPMFNCKTRIGLSATPRRRDGMEPVFLYHIGRVVSQVVEKKGLSHVRVLLVPYRGQDVNNNMMVWNGRLNTGRYFNRLARSADRTSLIVEMVKQLYKLSYNILVFSDRKTQLNWIQQELGPGYHTGKFISGQKELQTRVLLATYGSARMGKDFTNLPAIIMATPRVDIEQVGGRMRELPNAKSILVDIVDLASPIMIGWMKARIKKYKELGAEIDCSRLPEFKKYIEGLK